MLLMRGVSPAQRGRAAQTAQLFSKWFCALEGLSGLSGQNGFSAASKNAAVTALLFRALQRPEFCVHLIFLRQFSESKQTIGVLLPKSTLQQELGRAAHVLKYSQKFHLQTGMGKL